MNNQPVGVFDSGVGGLTVVKEIIKLLPHENLIYLGDTARIPYGSRSKDKIISFSLELTEFLLKRNIKMLVVACNTISATAIDEIRAISPVPVIEVISPTVELALKTSRNQRIGVIGTEATIESGIYKNSILLQSPHSIVFSKACPMLVPLIEEGFIDHTSTDKILREYLVSFKGTGIDTLILGCTHYPLIKKAIENNIPSNLSILDSAYPTAIKIKELLEEKKLVNQQSLSGDHTYLVTDNPKRAKKIAEIFYGRDIHEEFEKINLR